MKRQLKNVVTHSAPKQQRGHSNSVLTYQLSFTRPIPQWLRAFRASFRPPLRWLVQRHTSRACHRVGLRSCTLLLMATLWEGCVKSLDIVTLFSVSALFWSQIMIKIVNWSKKRILEVRNLDPHGNMQIILLYFVHAHKKQQQKKTKLMCIISIINSILVLEKKITYSTWSAECRFPDVITFLYLARFKLGVWQNDFPHGDDKPQGQEGVGVGTVGFLTLL